MGLLRTKHRSEQVFNYLLALSVLSWAVLGLAAGDNLGTPVRWVIAALHLTVAALLATRGPVVKQGSAWSIGASIPALVVAGWVFKAAPPPASWTVSAQVLFSAGGFLVIITFLFLDRSFAVLPAVREIVSKGPYRFVRHPAYAGELTMILACCVAQVSLGSMAPLVVALPLIVLRIYVEERVLLASPGYQGYAERVRWRLVPGLW